HPAGRAGPFPPAPARPKHSGRDCATHSDGRVRQSHPPTPGRTGRVAVPPGSLGGWRAMSMAMAEVPQTGRAPKDWRFPLSVGLTIGLAVPAARDVAQALEPHLGYW